MSASIPPTVLARYSPAFTGIRWTTVSGGFSGASVWRGEDAAAVPIFALKAWPAAMTRERLQAMHSWMTQAAYLPFVPQILRAANGDALVSHSDSFWDATSWMPGVPVVSPSVAELEAACASVGRLHRAWSVESVGVCPGVLNRLRLLQEFRESGALAPRAVRKQSGVGCGLWDTQTARGASGPQSGSESLDLLARRGWRLVAEKLDWAEQQLRPWETARVPLQPCVRDLRAEHVLLSHGEVSGIVDYGAMAIDHPAIDLARLFGEFDMQNETLRTAGLTAYRETGVPVSEEFVRILEQTGAVCSAVNWLLRLLPQRRNQANEAAVLSRFSGLLDRIERFAPK